MDIAAGVLGAFEETIERLRPTLESEFLTPQAKGSMRGNLMQALLPVYLNGTKTDLADMEILNEPTELKTVKDSSYPAANDNIFESKERPTRILIIRWSFIDKEPTVTEIRYGHHPENFQDVWTNHRKDGYKMRDYKMKEEFYDTLEVIYEYKQD